MPIFTELSCDFLDTDNGETTGKASDAGYASGQPTLRSLEALPNCCDLDDDPTLQDALQIIQSWYLHASLPDLLSIYYSLGIPYLV